MRVKYWGAALALLSFAASASADNLAEQGRAVFEKHKNAVVTVQLVIKQKFSMAGHGSQEDESKVEATGTIINPDGLTVLALSSTDPSSIIKNVMGSMMEGVQIDVEVSDIKILQPDGSEIPAQVVLRDNDLDLAYARPITKPESPMPYVDFTDAGPAQVLDWVVSVSRLGKVSNRVAAASYEQINAVVDKPRTFYIPGNDPTNTLQGSPAFTMDGKLVGVFVMRSIRGSGGMGGMMSAMGGGSDRNFTPIILPASDVLESAAQAPPFGEAPRETGDEDEGEDESTASGSDDTDASGAE